MHRRAVGISLMLSQAWDSAWMLGEAYALEELTLDPRDLGWPVARSRRYTVLVHKQRATLERRLADLPSVLGHPPGDELDGRLWCDVDVRSSPPLTPSMRTNLGNYFESLNGTKKLFIVDLSQNATVRPRHATIEGHLCTLTCGSRYLYVPSCRRLLTPTEALTS